MALLEVEFEDRTWNLDLDEISMGEARTIQRNTGKGLAAFTNGCLYEADPECLAWLYWLMQKQNGEKPADPNRANFKVAKFAAAIVAALEAVALASEDDDKEEVPKGDPDQA